MNRDSVCLFLSGAAAGIILASAAGTAIARRDPAAPETEAQSETQGVRSDEAANRDRVEAGRKKYCLVAEGGYLLIFSAEDASFCLNPHMPLGDFPPAEQEKLLEGIWFPSVLEILNYIESYTS